MYLACVFLEFVKKQLAAAAAVIHTCHGNSAHKPWSPPALCPRAGHRRPSSPSRSCPGSCSHSAHGLGATLPSLSLPRPCFNAKCRVTDLAHPCYRPDVLGNIPLRRRLLAASILVHQRAAVRRNTFPPRCPLAPHRPHIAATKIKLTRWWTAAFCSSDTTGFADKRRQRHNTTALAPALILRAASTSTTAGCRLLPLAMLQDPLPPTPPAFPAA